MFTCKICGKKFKASTELGGHMSSAHWRGKAETPSEPEMVSVEVASAAPQPRPKAATEEDPGVMDRIRGLYRQNYTPKQIKDKFGYSPRTVDQVGAEFIKPEGQPQSTTENEEHGEEQWLPASYKKDQVANPAVLLYKAIDGSKESEIEFRGMLKLRAAMLMVMDLVNIQKGQAEADAKRIDPVLKVLREGRDELDAAAARAKNSSYEIALQAAEEVAQGMKGAFSAELRDLKAAIPGQPADMNPMAKMFFNAMQPFAGQAIAQLFSSIFPGMQPQVARQVMEMSGQAQSGQAAQPSQPAHPEKLLWAPGEEDQWTQV